MLPFKTNYGYNPMTLLTPKQAKKTNKQAKKNKKTNNFAQKIMQISKISIKKNKKIL